MAVCGMTSRRPSCARCDGRSSLRIVCDVFIAALLDVCVIGLLLYAGVLQLPY